MSHSISSRQMQILALLVLIALVRFISHMAGVDFMPSLALDSGLLAFFAIGHCDTMDGPVITLAQKALEQKNVNLVLPWVRPEDEAQIRHAFEHAQAVRELGPQARSLADQHFFETLVRVHRAGEGAPYTGLKPAGLDHGPAVPAADQSLQEGSVEAVLKLLLDAVNTGVRARFQAAMAARGFNPDDVAAGRKYVEAYVGYVHYVEKIWQIAAGSSHHGQHGEHHAHHHN